MKVTGRTMRELSIGLCFEVEKALYTSGANTLPKLQRMCDEA